LLITLVPLGIRSDAGRGSEKVNLIFVIAGLADKRYMPSKAAR